MKAKAATAMFFALGAGLVPPAYAEDSPDSAEPAHQVTANIALVSDYRFRGVSQSFNEPAVQGGFDYSHDSGFYVGTWASSVSNNLYLNGGGMEWDFYGGFKLTPLDSLILDLGVIHYYYPGAHYNDASSTDYDTTELYVAIGYEWLTVKYSQALSDYFGTNEDTYGGYAPVIDRHGNVDAGQALPADRGDSKGSGYVELNASFDVAENTTLGLHAGHLAVKNYGELSYTDYKLSLARDFGWATVGLAAIASDADAKWYRYCESNGRHCENPVEDALVLSVGRSL